MTKGYFVSSKMKNIMGGSTMVVATLCLGGSYYVESEIGRAVFLGAFVLSLLHSMLVFGCISGKWIVNGDLGGVD